MRQSSNHPLPSSPAGESRRPRRGRAANFVAARQHYARCVARLLRSHLEDDAVWVSAELWVPMPGRLVRPLVAVGSGSLPCDGVAAQAPLVVVDLGEAASGVRPGAWLAAGVASTWTVLPHEVVVRSRGSATAARVPFDGVEVLPLPGAPTGVAVGRLAGLDVPTAQRRARDAREMLHGGKQPVVS